MADNDQILLSKLIGNLYNEVFQRRASSDNTIIKKSSHNIEQQPVDEHTKEFLLDAATVHVWGISGASDQVNNSGSISGRWSFASNWG